MLRAPTLTETIPPPYGALSRASTEPPGLALNVSRMATGGGLHPAGLEAGTWAGSPARSGHNKAVRPGSDAR